jgi:hypothetical protein
VGAQLHYHLQGNAGIAQDQQWHRHFAAAPDDCQQRNQVHDRRQVPDENPG